MFDTLQFFLAIGVFLAVTLLAWLILAQLVRDQWRQRVEAIRGGGKDAPAGEAFSSLKGMLQSLGTLSGEARDTRMRRQLAQAGYRDPAAVAVYGGTRVLLAFVSLALGWMFVPDDWSAALQRLVIVLAAASGFYLPRWLLSSRVRERQQAMARALPDALDLMTIAVDAGLGLDAAMLRATQKMSLQSEGLQREWEAAWMEMQAGVPRATALRNLADRCGLEDLQLLVTLLNSAEQMGVPIAGALRNFAATLRLKRHQRAEECAAQMPTKLLFPLVVFILPVMLMVVGGPAAIQILRTLASLQH